MFSAAAALAVLPGACVLGLHLAGLCARITDPSAGQFRFLNAFLASIAVAIFGFLLCVYWRTRVVGASLIVSAVLLALVFQGRMAWLTRRHEVAWRVPLESAPSALHRKFAVIVYFHKGTTARQIEDFTSTVLEQPGQPMHPEPEYPWFVSQHLALKPEQANGFQGAAVDFRATAPAGVTEAYVEKIRSDPRVDKLFLKVAPGGIHLEAEAQ